MNDKGILGKKVYLDPHAEKELRKFNEGIQDEFESYFRILRERGRIDFPDAKKIKPNLFEIRVSVGDEYRGFYGYIAGERIVVVHIFQKKTQKTPKKHLELAEKRLKIYEQSQKQH